MRLTDEEEVEYAGMYADRHPERYPQTRNVEAPGFAQRPTHRNRRVGGACFVFRTREQKQQRVASKLQESSAIGVRDCEEVGKAASDGVDE